MASLAAQTHKRARRRMPPSALIVGIEPGRGLDVVVLVERTNRLRGAIWVRYTIVDPIDRVLAASMVKIPLPIYSLLQRVHLRRSLRVLTEHAVWRHVLDAGQSIRLRWRIELVNRRGLVIGTGEVAQEFCADQGLGVSPDGGKR